MNTDTLPDILPAPAKYDLSADVIIIGLGAAGLSAAIAAKQAGADVIAFDRASGPGGTTNMAAGHVYMGGGTPAQTANGFSDSADEMFAYLMENTPYPETGKIRAYCDDSLAHYNWLIAQGVPFNTEFYPAKDVMQWGPECLIWSGNENVWPIRDNAKPAPRGHKVAREGEGGILLIDSLFEMAKSLGIEMTFNSRAAALIRNKDRIAGVQISQFGKMRKIEARKGVILCAGGFSMNAEMLAAECPRLADARIEKQGTPGDDGSGIKLGQSAGGHAQYLSDCFVTSPFYPPGQLVKGLLVNKDGVRFVAEDSYHSKSAAACLEQTDSAAYLIADSSIFERPAYGWQPLIDGYENIAEMETGLGIENGRLQKTLSDYNENAAKGEDPEFHKHPDYLMPLTTAPYAAFDLSLGQAHYVGFTLGGLKTSMDGHVLRADGGVIERLYAAGACASNIAQDARGYSSGTCLGEATYFGRRAGTMAAE